MLKKEIGGERKQSLESHEYRSRVSTGTAVTVIFQMDVDRVTEFATELLGLFLGERTAGDNYWVVRIPPREA